LQPSFDEKDKKKKSPGDKSKIVKTEKTPPNTGGAKGQTGQSPGAHMPPINGHSTTK